MKRFMVALCLGTVPAWMSAGIPTRTFAANATPVQQIHSCPASSVGFAHCNAILVVPNTQGGSGPSGLNPVDLQTAYNLPSSTAGGGKTVAVIDAYDDPSAEADLAVYRNQFGLPACTTANGCFRKVDESGGTAYPKANGSWAQEISVDLDMVSATCPNCRLLLVETSPSFNDLLSGIDTAASLGANAISNSYGVPEYSSELSDQTHLNHPGVAITAGSGDVGFGAEFPAASAYVTSVGGTSLTKAAGTTRGWTETAWAGAGSGCSAYVAKPAWQTDAGCANRSISDISVEGDPNTGVSVYDSYNYKGFSGWLIFGGTSVGSPIVAGMYALAGNTDAINDGSYPYAHGTYTSSKRAANTLNDVTTGSNGSCGTYICNAGTGYDGPTGLGTPWGVGAL